MHVSWHWQLSGAHVCRTAAAGAGILKGYDDYVNMVLEDVTEVSVGHRSAAPREGY